jgi:hypothetical protein
MGQGLTGWCVGAGAGFDAEDHVKKAFQRTNLSDMVAETGRH